MSPRFLRRIIIALIFLAIFFFSGYGFIKITEPVATCSDGIQNGQEEGIDCGFFACNNYCEPELEPPQVLSAKLISTANGDYDFVAEVINPHQDFGASEVVYELNFIDITGNEILSRQDVFYILPGQTKYIILPFLDLGIEVSDVGFSIKSATWQKIESLEGLNLIVRNQKYTRSSNGQSSFLDVAIFNGSQFDFEVVDIDVVLLNARGDVVGVNKSDIRTFIAGTERSFRVTWPFRLSGEVSKIEIKPSTNLFENSNYIKSYGSDIEKFQEY